VFNRWHFLGTQFIYSLLDGVKVLSWLLQDPLGSLPSGQLATPRPTCSHDIERALSIKGAVSCCLVYMSKLKPISNCNRRFVSSATLQQYPGISGTTFRPAKLLIVPRFGLISSSWILAYSCPFVAITVPCVRLLPPCRQSNSANCHLGTNFIRPSVYLIHQVNPWLFSALWVGQVLSRGHSECVWSCSATSCLPAYH
jgi:hypothetical protein